MSCLSTFNLCASQGDTFTKSFTFSKRAAEDEQPVLTDLTGVAAELLISHDRNGIAEFVYSGAPEITFPNASAGELLLTIPPEETALWTALRAPGGPNAANYQYQLRFTWPDGLVETVLTGTFVVLLAVGL